MGGFSSSPSANYGVHVPAILGQPIGGIFQLSLDRLWQACSSSPWTVYGRHVPVVPGQTVGACSSCPLADYGGHIPAIPWLIMALMFLLSLV